MDIKQFCENVAKEQFARRKKLDSADERLQLIKVLLDYLDKTQNDLCIMTELLRDLEKYEREEQFKQDAAIDDMYQREEWK